MLKVNELDWPEDSVPESQAPLSLVVVCSVLWLLVQVIFSPTLIVRLSGWKAKLLIDTALPDGFDSAVLVAVAVAVGVLVAVLVAVGVGVAVAPSSTLDTEAAGKA